MESERATTPVITVSLRDQVMSAMFDLLWEHAQRALEPEADVPILVEARDVEG